MLCLMRRQAVEPEAEGVEFRILGMEGSWFRELRVQYGLGFRVRGLGCSGLGRQLRATSTVETKSTASSKHTFEPIVCL